MKFSLVSAALLGFTTWMCLVCTTHGHVKNCCLQWSTTIVPVKRIMNYTIQSEGACTITAVLFKTALGNTICSNPNSKWAKRAILKVDNETKVLLEKGQNEEGSTNDMTPAASTTPKNASQKRGRNGRRRQKKKGQRRRA